MVFLSKVSRGSRSSGRGALHKPCCLGGRRSHALAFLPRAGDPALRTTGFSDAGVHRPRQRAGLRRGPLCHVPAEPVPGHAEPGAQGHPGAHREAGHGEQGQLATPRVQRLGLGWPRAVAARHLSRQRGRGGRGPALCSRPLASGSLSLGLCWAALPASTTLSHGEKPAGRLVRESGFAQVAVIALPKGRWFFHTGKANARPAAVHHRAAAGCRQRRPHHRSARAQHHAAAPGGEDAQPHGSGAGRQAPIAL